LSIDGAVKHPFVVTYDELKRMPAKTVVTTLECAGNGRVFLIPPKPGAQWGWVRWERRNGPAFARDAAGSRGARRAAPMRSYWREADRGVAVEKPSPADSTASPEAWAWTRRSTTFDRVRHERRRDSQHHGFPVRAIVPGHYGVASTKWLTHIRVIEEPFQGYWQTVDYGYWDESHGFPVRRPLSLMKLKSQSHALARWR